MVAKFGTNAHCITDLRQVFWFLGSFWKFLWPETWHLRHWLHFWQLRTTIWTITLWPLNREWWWQHSQFLRCLFCPLSPWQLRFAGWLVVWQASQSLPWQFSTLEQPIYCLKPGNLTSNTILQLVTNVLTFEGPARDVIPLSRSSVHQNLNPASNSIQPISLKSLSTWLPVISLLNFKENSNYAVNDYLLNFKYLYLLFMISKLSRSLIRYFILMHSTPNSNQQ